MDTHFFAGLTKFKLDAGKFRRDDDFSDRFSHTFTSLLLIIFTLIISARQYIGKPIACWVPTEFTRAQEEFAESVCWVTSTYFIPTADVNVPELIADRENRKLHYYQWVPFMLMLQALFFNLPCIIWRLFNWQSGIHLSSIMEVACEIEMIKDSETRKSNITYVARHIEDALTTQREYRTGCAIRFRHCLARTCCLWFGKRYGNYLICLYLITKSLYIFNVVGQFFIMNRMLGTNYTFYGLDLLRDLTEGYMWQESGNFPRITMCDFEIRQLANKHRHSVQCVLPINMFNEKIFIFLWFWFVLVAAVNTSSFLYWSYKSSFRLSRIYFIRKFLKLRDALQSGDKKRSITFVDSYLRQDGIFILRLISQNAGELVASEIIERLWLLYKSHQNVSTQNVENVPSFIPRQIVINQSNNQQSSNVQSLECTKKTAKRSTQHRLRQRSSSSSNNPSASCNQSIQSANAADSNRGKPPSYLVHHLVPPSHHLRTTDAPPLPPPPIKKVNNSDGTSSSITNESNSLSVPESANQLARMHFGYDRIALNTTSKNDASSINATHKALLAKSGPLSVKTDHLSSHSKIRSSHMDEDPGDFV